MDQAVLERDLVARYYDEIQRLIAEDFLVDAIERTFDFVRDLIPSEEVAAELRKEVTLISGRHARLRGALRTGRQHNETANDVAAALMELVEQVARSARLREQYTLRQSAASAKAVAALSASIADTLAANSADQMRRLYLQAWRRQEPRRAVITARGVSHSYRGRFTLGPLDFELHAGEITGVVGMNASGKTTLIRLILGELQPNAGELGYDGLPGARKNDWRTVRGHIGYVPQLPGRWPGRLRHNLQHMAAANGILGRENLERVNTYIHRYGLLPYQDASWSEISGGFKIRFELVRALLTAPKVLILDEPLAYLDIITQQTFLHDVTTIARSLEMPIPVLVTSQHLYEIEAIADRMIILDDGRCLFSGPMGELPGNPMHEIFEISAQLDKSTLLERLRPAGLDDLERTATGWILIFRKVDDRATLAKAVLEATGNQFEYIRDITRSTRALFRNRRDDFDASVKLDKVS
jgi:ABC-type multidrug transport system ATPase subunit